MKTLAIISVLGLFLIGATGCADTGSAHARTLGAKLAHDAITADFRPAEDSTCTSLSYEADQYYDSAYRADFIEGCEAAIKSTLEAGY